MLASRRAAALRTSFPGYFSAARAAAKNGGDGQRRTAEPFAPKENHLPTQPPSDPTSFYRSLAKLGGKHALFGRWLEDRVSRLPVPVPNHTGSDSAFDDENSFYVHPSLEARRAPGAGVGVFAASAIAPGHVVFRVPSALFETLSATHAQTVARRRAFEFVERCEKTCAALGAPSFATHALFALHVLFELGDVDSENRGYLASLPSSRMTDGNALDAHVDDASDVDENAEMSVPLLWDARKLATLRGTPTLAAVARRRAFVEAFHAALFGENAENNSVSLHQFKWALSTILSRATSGARAPYALAPGVDLFNHGGADANCALEAKRFLGSLTRAETDLSFSETETAKEYASLAVSCVSGASADAQLTISYGDAADNDRLLRVYGFALPGNPNDRRELRLRVEGAALESWRAFERFGPGIHLARRAILRKHGLPRLASFDELEAEMEHEDAFRTAEKALGGGVAFRDPGDFRSALGNAFPDPAENAETSSEDLNEDSGAVFFDDVELDAEPLRSSGASSRGDDEERRAASGSPPRDIVWRCYVAHPAAAPFPARPSSPMDSASPEAERLSDLATAAARGVRGGAVSADALLAAVRVHLLTGTEPPGPDGHEPDPWAPVSEMNEAATRAVVGEAAYAALRAHVESLRPNVNDQGEGAATTHGQESAAEDHGHSHGHHGHGHHDHGHHDHGAIGDEGERDPFAAPSSDPRAALSPAAAAGARLDLAGGEAWARSALALRRGQEEILEHVLGRSSI